MIATFPSPGRSTVTFVVLVANVLLHLEARPIDLSTRSDCIVIIREHSPFSVLPQSSLIPRLYKGSDILHLYAHPLIQNETLLLIYCFRKL